MWLVEGYNRPHPQKGIRWMRLSHARRAVSVRFDDPNLVSCAGLAAVLALAARCGLGRLDPLQNLRASAPGRACRPPARAGPRPGFGRFAVAVIRQGGRVLPIPSEVLRLARLSDLQSLSGEQCRAQRRGMDLVDSGSWPEVDWVEPP
jgi:hypothetical protein